MYAVKLFGNLKLFHKGFYWGCELAGLGARLKVKD